MVSVTGIYNYYKNHGIKTQVMGASFRNTDEIIELAGCDLLTIAPKLLSELSSAEGSIEKKLDESTAASMQIDKISLNESHFRWMLCEDPMGTEKLYEGIRNFAKDARKLEALLLSRL